MDARLIYTANAANRAARGGFYAFLSYVLIYYALPGTILIDFEMPTGTGTSTEATTADKTPCKPEVSEFIQVTDPAGISFCSIFLGTSSI